MNTQDPDLRGKNYVESNGDIIPVTDIDDGYGAEWEEPGEVDTGFPVNRMIGAEAALRVVENAQEMNPVTGVCAKTLEQIVTSQDWQKDLIVLHNLGLDVFSVDDYETLRTKDCDTFQRVIRNFRQSLVYHYKKIQSVDGNIELAPSLDSIYGKKCTAAELLELAEVLEQLVADIDESGVIDPSQDKTSIQLGKAPDYTDVVVSRGTDNRLKLDIVKKQASVNLSHTA